LLVDNKFTAKIYYTDATMAFTFGGLIDRQSELFIPGFSLFFDDCKNNNLPNYCFLEPRYNASDGNDPMAASDQHPDHDVEEGETLIQDVFNAIRSNRETWESTLLVIVYDEHGGLFDHVPPPAAVTPDGINSGDPFFAFDRLGARARRFWFLLTTRKGPSSATRRFSVIRERWALWLTEEIEDKLDRFELKIAQIIGGPAGVRDDDGPLPTERSIKRNIAELREVLHTEELTALRNEMVLRSSRKPRETA
jgi:hypothetical protein